MVRPKRQITLPADVTDAGSIRVNDLIDWRFEGGELRGRKLQPAICMSYEACKRAIATTKIKLTSSWDELKKETR